MIIRKKNAMLIAAILVLSSFIMVVQFEKVRADGNILYVGGTGPGNYTEIQHAIDNASGGDTIFVYNGTYNATYPDEQIWIHGGPLHLIGEDKNTTIIGCPLAYHGAPSCILTGFTIEGFLFRIAVIVPFMITLLELSV